MTEETQPHPALLVAPYVRQRIDTVHTLMAAQAAAAVAAKLAAGAPSDLRDRYSREAEQYSEQAKAAMARVEAIDAVVAELGADVARWYGIVREQARRQQAAAFDAQANA